MTPTNRLQWRKIQHKDRPYADLTLQQWWAEYDAFGAQITGEWRDVPVEEIKHD